MPPELCYTFSPVLINKIHLNVQHYVSVTSLSGETCKIWLRCGGGGGDSVNIWHGSVGGKISKKLKSSLPCLFHFNWMAVTTC